jgi:hypothetical protein
MVPRAGSSPLSSPRRTPPSPPSASNLLARSPTSSRPPRPPEPTTPPLEKCPCGSAPLRGCRICSAPRRIPSSFGRPTTRAACACGSWLLGGRRRWELRRSRQRAPPRQRRDSELKAWRLPLLDRARTSAHPPPHPTPIPCLTISIRCLINITPYHLVSPHITPCHTIPYHTIPYHTIPYLTTPPPTPQAALSHARDSCRAPRALASHC